MGETVDFEQAHSDKFEDCPVAIASLGNQGLVIGFGSGCIRVFNHHTRISEIAAHARWITGLDAFSDLQMLATTSEDTVLNVWRITQDAGVELLYSSRVTDKLLTGVSFLKGG